MPDPLPAFLAVARAAQDPGLADALDRKAVDGLTAALAALRACAGAGETGGK